MLGDRCFTIAVKRFKSLSIDTKMSQESTSSSSTQLSLTVKDLFLLEQCIRVCHTRGAFKIEEMGDVSSVYVKLKRIVDEQQQTNANLASMNTSTSSSSSSKTSRMSVIDE